MGLLDDAIREHLDLKRRRGADPTEVERAEQEALGPVRRGPEPEPAEVAAGAEAAYDLEEEQAWEEEPFGEEPDAFAAPTEGRRRFSPSDLFKRSSPLPAEEAPLADEPGSADEQQLADEQRFVDDPDRVEEPPPPRFVDPAEQKTDFFAEDPRGDPFAEDDHPGPPLPHAAPPAPPSGGVAPSGGETVEYRIDEALEHDPKKEGEDVLEETPEFLQDTPDHDRLWFEQRPPKDFDFEG